MKGILIYPFLKFFIMTEEMKAKRSALHEMSQTAKEIIDDGRANTINEGLKIMYAENGHTQLKTFNQWLKDGLVVKRGEKALMLWAKPLREQKGKRNQQENPEEENGKDFFPVAYVFSNLQVELLKTKAALQQTQLYNVELKKGKRRDLLKNGLIFHI